MGLGYCRRRRGDPRIAAQIDAALDDAGLSPADVDGMTTFTLDNNEDVDLVRALGIENLRFSSRVPHGGGGSTGTLAHAMAAVSSGLANVVVAWRARRWGPSSVTSWALTAEGAALVSPGARRGCRVGDG